MGGKLESKLPLQAAEEPPYPTASRAWYVLGLLTLVYVFSFLDRTILSLLVGPIRHDLHITDTQVSLLMGFSSRSSTHSLVFPSGAWPTHIVAET